MKWQVIGSHAATALLAAVLGAAGMTWYLKTQAVKIAQVQVLYEKEPQEIGPSRQHNRSFELKFPSVVSVKVVERFGQNIEYSLLLDGKVSARSRIQKGVAQGEHLVNSGLISINVKNDNLLDTKHVLITVKVKRVAPIADAITR